jgi:hypothetical protein
MLGLEQKLGSGRVIYADDLAILCKRGRAEEALARPWPICMRSWEN